MSHAGFTMVLNFLSTRRSRTIALFFICLLLLVAEVPASAFADSVDYLYATGAENSLRVFAADTGTLVNTLPARGEISCIAASGDGHYVYVAEEDSIDRIETDGNSVSASVSYPSAASDVSALVIGTDHRLYVADTGKKCINIYTADLTYLDTLPVNTGSSVDITEGYVPLYLSISPDGRRLYAGCAYGQPGAVASVVSEDYSLLVFDADTGERLSVLGLHSADSSGSASASKYRLRSMTVNPAGDYLWLGVYLTDTSGNVIQETSQLLALSMPVSDSSVTQALYVPPVPVDLVFSADGKQLFALSTNAGQAGIVSYDPKNFLIGRLFTVNNPSLRHGVLSSGTGKLYVSTDRGYTIVDTGTGSLRDIPVSGSVDRFVIVSLEVSPTPLPTSASTTTPLPTPAPAATPAVGTASTTPTPMPSATISETVTPCTEPFAPSASPLSVPSAAPLASAVADENAVKCLGMPILSIGAAIALRPLLETLRRKRAP